MPLPPGECVLQTLRLLRRKGLYGLHRGEVGARRFTGGETPPYKVFRLFSVGSTGIENTHPAFFRKRGALLVYCLLLAFCLFLIFLTCFSIFIASWMGRTLDSR